MKQPWEVIAELEADNSRLIKEAIILEQAKDDNYAFFEGVRLALDAMVTFGIKKVPEKTEADADGPGLSWDIFKVAITGFTNRTATGNAAKELVKYLMSNATREQWNNWYRRILIKDLRCGVSEKTINNVVKKNYPQYSVPVFSCQLAHDSANHESKVAGEKLIEVKLDGVRVITIVYPTGRVDQFSRNGKELVNFEHIKQQLSAVADSFDEPWVLDGEVMSSSFQDLMKQVHRKENVAANDAILNLFDMIPLSEFEQGYCANPQIDRSNNLQGWFNGVKHLLTHVDVLGHERVNLNTEEGNTRFKEINKTAVELGYEGIMIKDPSAPYECKRTTAWLKLKPFIEVSLEVTNFEEGTGRNQGRLGALVCEGMDDGRHIVVNVGSGFTDANRDDFWAGRNDVVGQIVEVRADAVTRNQDGTYSLRFPRFRRFRGFVPGEKL